MRHHRTIQGYILEDDIFKYALVLSLLIHVVIFAQLSSRASRHLSKTFQNVEITYYNLKLQTKEADIRRKDEITKKGPDKNTEVKLDRKAGVPPPVKDMSKLNDKIAAVNKQPVMFKELQVKHKVLVPPLKSEKINNPLYQSYYQAVRNVIRERAYANYSQLDAGEVYLTFVILSSGTVKQVQLIDDKTTANDYLRKISLKSIEEANPFPPFPKELNYPELSFNVAISFEVEQ